MGRLLLRHRAAENKLASVASPLQVPGIKPHLPAQIGVGPAKALHRHLQAKPGVPPKAPSLPPRPAIFTAAPAAVLQRARNNFKHYEGKSAATAVRMSGAGVKATGILTLGNGEQVEKTGSNGDHTSNLGDAANRCWAHNQAEVKRLNAQGKRLPYPDNDAEVSVLQKLKDQIDADGLDLTGATLSLHANGTPVCKYCRKLIRAFCGDYGITWSDDPQYT